MTLKRVKRNKRWTLMKVGFSLYLVIGVFALIGLRTAVVNLEYELGELNKQKISLIRKNRLLTARRASFYSAREIENIATKKLGMSIPERDRIFFVKRSTVAGPYKVSMESDPRRLSKVRSLWE